MKFLIPLVFVLFVFTAEAQKPGSTPKNIRKWLTEKTASKKMKPKRFFLNDSIKIVGYIKGYDKSASFASGIIYHKNNISNEDLPTTVRIYEDGRFECRMLGIHPISTKIFFDSRGVNFYAEPGTTTGIVLDWTEFLSSNENREGGYEFKNVEYLGPNKTINDGLASVKMGRPNYDELEGYIKGQKPEDFKIAQVQNWESARKSLDSTTLAKRTPDKIKKLLLNKMDLTYANYLFDYESDRAYYQQQEPNNEILKLPMPENYFDFLDKIDLDDQLLLVLNDFSTLINRYEFSPVFPTKESQLVGHGKWRNAYLMLDSAYLSKNRKTNLVYDIAKLRLLASNFKFKRYQERTFAEETESLAKTMREAFLTSEMNRMYAKYKAGNVAYELPNTNAALVFKKIINPLKGKILIVDFWAQWCGPCRSGIESSLALRKKYKDNPDFDFVFVTDTESTETAFYDDYIKTNSMINTHRVTGDEYLAFRELFKFNGIPRYILVTAEGKIQDDNFASYNLQSEFKKYFPEKFPLAYWK